MYLHKHLSQIKLDNSLSLSSLPFQPKLWNKWITFEIDNFPACWKNPLWTVENVCSVSLEEAAIRVSFIKARQMGVCRVQAAAGTKTYRRDGPRSAWGLYFTAYGIDERGRHRKFNLPGNERDPVSRYRFDHVTFAPRMFLSSSVCIFAEIIAICHASTSIRQALLHHAI